MSLAFGTARCRLCAARLPGKTPSSQRSVSKIFSRREKRKIRNLYPRPDRDPTALYPPLSALFETKVTQADGSSFYLQSASPRPSITLVRDITNHPLWNPSLAREAAEFDQSGRGGRFARRFAGLNVHAGGEPEAAKPGGLPSGFGVEDLDWMSGETVQSVGASNAPPPKAKEPPVGKGKGGKGK